ncbi:hypothetical protein C8F04DRAFT_1363278 [Mycena alexandri]|uniref:Uncharacterized protein n=1 Tax=Mycena alexandri TaxID=1745969 RepID=A0AAD6WP94_9AGAR|nr:hypothetical protein C8F04DRAFT_1363278 [Mycena alexandri]
MSEQTFEFVHVEPSSQPPPPIAKGYKKVKWAPYTPADASGTSKPALNPRSIASDIPLDKLRISKAQRAALDTIYQQPTAVNDAEGHVDHLFKLNSHDQIHAAAIMAQQGLDLDARENLSNRWSQQWSSNSSKSEPTRRVYITGCLAHTEITYVVSSQKILRIRGYFQHNQDCKDALFTRIPPIPVHPFVFAVALAQLRDGSTFTDVKNKNRELFAARNYHGFPADIRESPYRWLIETRDSRSLFRQHNRLNGIKVTEKPQINIDEWLDPSSPEYNSTIADAIFHYSARASKGERFETCIATDEMRETAWKYGHESQIILDGRSGSGIPVAFLLFSAPTGNKQSSAGYNTAILTKLLQAWKDSLTRCAHLHGFTGIIFNPFSAITDTDLKERGALIVVWITIWLLICRFHLRQSWKNYRNKLLKGKDGNHRRGTRNSHWRNNTLLLLPNSKAVRKALKHVKYLSEYWTQQRAIELVNLRQISMPIFLPDGSGLSFTCYSSEALEVESQPLQYTITILFNGVATCQCTDFRKYGGAFKILKSLPFPFPNLLPKRTPWKLGPRRPRSQKHPRNPRKHLSFQRYAPAAAVTDLLRNDDSCHDTVSPEEEEVNEDDSDNESVDTDASSDSDESDDESDDAPETAPQVSHRPPQNQLALGEQALARTLFELEDMGQKLGDLAEYLKHHPGPLSDSSREEIAQGRPPTTAGGGHYLYGGHHPPRHPPRRLHRLSPPPSSSLPSSSPLLPSPAPLPSNSLLHHITHQQHVPHVTPPLPHITPDAPARRPDPRPRPY